MDKKTIDTLLSQSMLEQANKQAPSYGGTSRMWQQPYGNSRPRDALEQASAWLNLYPASIITAADQSVITTLSNESLLYSVRAIGLDALHIGPTKQAGAYKNGAYEQSIDGHFDRTGLNIDPAFGTTDEFITMQQQADKLGLTVIDDIIPGHTGKGSDFLLALARYNDYPGLYHMVEIDRDDWELLPDVDNGNDSVNLSPQTVEALHQKGYIVGKLSRVIFYKEGVKETNWSATNIVKGVDGVSRRWVYLHYFKDGQPTLNWLDPSFAAQRMILADAIHSIDTLGAKILRLDANGFLGIEAHEHDTAWSEGHPLSLTANQLIAGMVRKTGGFTFQELNLTIDDIAVMSRGGADLSYDFVTRTAYYHALIAGDTEFLRLMLNTMHEYGVDPVSLVHALQNHDELTLELVHFWTVHKDDIYTYQNNRWTGSQLRDHIRQQMYDALTGNHAAYNHRFVENGIAGTTLSLIAASLGITDIQHMTNREKATIQKVHLLFAMFNALQPGAFALSGWDLIGALPLDKQEVKEYLADGDTRWVARGGYDLMGETTNVAKTNSGIPKTVSIYGSIPKQLEDSDSFVNNLSLILAVRKKYGIYAARQISVPDVRSKGLLIMIHELPRNMGLQITVLNFSKDEIVERITIDQADPNKQVIDMITGREEDKVSENNEIEIKLSPYEGKSLYINSESNA